MDGPTLTIHTTTVCTLRCKDCSYHYPWFEVPVMDDCGQIFRSLDKIFEIFETVNELRPGGAEAFLYPKIEELLLGFMKYKKLFKRLCIITNGTYVPKEKVLKTFANLDCEKLIRIDDYGKLSTKTEELVSALNQHSIPNEVRPYNDTEQTFGGWVDMGIFEYQNYSDEELKTLFKNCRVPDDCLFLWDGRLYNCSYCAAGYKFGKIPLAPREAVDLFDGSSVEEKRNVIRAWKDEPFLGCGYCFGFDPKNSPRIPAAIQMED